MPGDFTAAFKDEKGNDQIGYMIPYGAASVDVRSPANGEKYQLKPGSTVKIEIPLPKHLEGSKFIPKTIPFLEYNKEKGIWEKIGEGIFNENTQVYTATTTQFSSFNMDVLFTNQACLVINGTGIKKDYKLQVDFFYNDRSWIQYRDASANEIYALYGLPPDIPYTLRAYKTLTDPLIMIDCKTCTPGPQVPSTPLNPDPGTDFEFPACDCDPNPVMLSADRPVPPTDLTYAEPIGCNYIDLEWVGTANGPEEGYIIKVYTYVGDPKPVVYTAPSDDTILRVEGLNSSTIYYFHIHQYDEYAEFDSEPYPTPPDSPLAVETSASQIFSIINEICDNPITQVYFNGGPDNQLLPGEVINYGINESHEFSVCQRPESVQVTTGPYSYNFEIISADSIIVRELVKILPGSWGGDPLQFPGPIRTLVFQENGNLTYDDGAGTVRPGTYQEFDQVCPNEISFLMSIDELGVSDCHYIFADNKIIIDSFPSAPPVLNAVFKPV